MEFKNKNILSLTWSNEVIKLNGHELFRAEQSTELTTIPAMVYRHFGIAYAKFFKMDLLSKVAFLSAELLLKDQNRSSIPNERIATIISTKNGSLEVDKAFEQSRKEIASPALFVYTLPNIMLGEISIRNSFKGEQVCLITEDADDKIVPFYVDSLLKKDKISACLFGFVDAVQNKIEVKLNWLF